MSRQLSTEYLTYGKNRKLEVNKIENNIRFQGQYEDTETGLYYNRFRYYNPHDGGYINADPIGLSGGLNLFNYPRDPIHWIDPWGLKGEYDVGRYGDDFDNKKGTQKYHLN